MNPSSAALFQSKIYDANRFSMKKQIGEGAYGVAFKAFDEHTRQWVVLKKYRDSRNEKVDLKALKRLGRMNIQAEDLSNVRGAADVEYSALVKKSHFDDIRCEPLSVLDDFEPAMRKDELHLGPQRYPDQVAAISHDVVREVAAVKDCTGHENIVQLLDVFRVKGSGRVIVSLRCEEGGSLSTLLHAKNKIWAKWNNDRKRMLDVERANKVARRRGLPIPLVISLAR